MCISWCSNYIKMEGSLSDSLSASVMSESRKSSRKKVATAKVHELESQKGRRTSIRSRAPKSRALPTRKSSKRKVGSGHSESDDEDGDVPQSSRKRHRKKRREHHSSSSSAEEVEEKGNGESDMEVVEDEGHEGNSEGQGIDEVCTNLISGLD